MRVPKPQVQQSLNPKDYKVRIVVFGTRHYNNRKEFHHELMEYIEQFEGQDILFISGDAKSGADYLIIRWCLKFGYPCKRMPADWDNDGKAAGFIRNTEMAKISTNGLGFWNGHSNGTGQMLEELEKFKVPHRKLIVEIDNEV